MPFPSGVQQLIKKDTGSGQCFNIDGWVTGRAAGLYKTTVTYHQRFFCWNDSWRETKETGLCRFTSEVAIKTEVAKTKNYVVYTDLVQCRQSRSGSSTSCT